MGMGSVTLLDTLLKTCYFLMELASGYIVEVEVRDKLHVGVE